ncbi:MAG TPA: hypothetical protein VN669_10055 [Candidatus Acidoferrales bacterium]|jgi:hypothetical protein|nr:hypothetical protein [Candidatus Acidoferrales bacterium]
MAHPQRFRLPALMLGLAMMFSFAFAQNARAQEQQSEHFQKTFTVSPGTSLNVENYKGAIHVAAADVNQVTVDVQKRFEGSSDSDRKWWMENVKVDFQNDPTHVKVKVEYPNQNCTFCFDYHDYTAAVELEIRVPRQINVALDGYKPDVRISGVEGNIAIKSYKSPMLIEATTGGIHIDTYKDTIRLQNVRIRGALEVKSYKADTEVSARDLGQSADLETEKGDITVRVPANAGLDVDYSGGRRATFHSDFQLAVASGSGEDVRGTVNGGGTKLRLRTVKGSVTLQRISGEL